MSDSFVPDLKMSSPVRLKCHCLRLAALLPGVCFASAVMAHDFWVQPNAYWLTPDVVTPMTLQVGHGPFRQRSPIRLSRITRFEAVTPDGGRIDLRDGLHLGDDQKDGDLRLRAHGAHVLVFETDAQAQSHLPAIRFNDYLEAEGL